VVLVLLLQQHQVARLQTAVMQLLIAVAVAAVVETLTVMVVVVAAVYLLFVTLDHNADQAAQSHHLVDTHITPLHHLELIQDRRYTWHILQK